MNTFSLPSKSVVYVMDAYCGWCWGFSGRMGEFAAANQGRVAFTALSGGLFLAERAAPISNYPHIPAANDRITRLTGAVFGEAYQRLVHEGNAVMDSLGAAQGLAALRAQAPDRAVHWAHELQAAFYGRGLSLSDHDTIADIAATNGLNAAAVLRDLQDGSAQLQAKRDFALVRQLGASSYPTLLFVNGDDVHQLPATGTALQDLNQRLDALLA